MEMRLSLWIAEMSEETQKIYGKVPRLTISPNTKHLSYKGAVVKGNNGLQRVAKRPRGKVLALHGSFPKTLKSYLTRNQSRQTEALSGSSQCSICYSCSISSSLAWREQKAISNPAGLFYWSHGLQISRLE